MKSGLVKALTFFLAVALVALLYRLTLYEEDPCEQYQQDISGAVLAEQEGDQGGLVNRAILMRGLCEERKAAESEGANTLEEEPSKAQPESP